MALSYEDIVQGAYGAIGRTGIGTGAGKIDQEGYNFWLNALKAGIVTPDQLYANFNQAVASTVQQQPQAVNSQAVASYIAANPLATQIDPKKVVAVGDSTTWGYNAGNQVADNMVVTAQKALGSDYSVSNLGINSTTAGDFLNSSDFDKALSSGAGTVVLNYGMNEAFRNEDPATFANNLLTAVQTLQAVGKKVILQTPNSTGAFTKPEDAWTQNVGAYADVVRTVAQQTGSTLDDKFTYTGNLSNATSAADIVHPTAATYGLLGTNLADAIKTTTTGVAPKAISVTAPVTSAQTPSLVANQVTAPANPLVKLYQDTLGRTPTQEEIDGWNFGDTIDARELDRFLGSARNEVVNTKPATGAVGNIASQILAQGTTANWAGEGFGSPEKNAYDMALMLAGQGITDIKDFGQRTNADGNKEFYNKLTGNAINPYYDKAARVGPDIWGGTFAGKDSTAYGVKFDAAGNPLFFTQSGGDSADVPSWVAPALVLGAAYFGLDASGLLAGGAGAGAGAAGLTAAEIAGLTATDLAIGAGSYGAGAYGAGAAGLGAAGLTAADLAIGGGSYGAGGLGATGLTAAEIAGLNATDLAIGGGGLAGYAPLTAAEIAGLTATDLAIGGTAGAAGLLPGAVAAGGTGLLSSGGAASTVGGAATGGVTAGGVSTGGLTSGLTSALTNAGVSGAINSVLGGGSNLSNLFSGGLGTAGNLLQMQQSKEAAQQAQARIDAETAAAKQAAAFKPIGMTTRFGTSQFQVDPVTGQLKSAGYTLSPEAKAQQDRFVALSNAGLTQAEAAQAQFAPLQTGAQSLFSLGNQYLAKSPQDVAQNYLNQQMALLQPGRELELATLQNKLQQQGRGGLSVAQGGTYGATTPELQALYNARAKQEAELTAYAQQAGQKDVLFGAGLLGQGSTAMGNYYAGQQAAYAPYTTAMTQVKDLETLGQKPFTMSTDLAQLTSAAGSRVGELGLRGAGQSVALATGADATRNLGAQSLIAAGNPNAQFGQAFSGLFSGGLQSAFGQTPLGASGFGTGLSYGNQDLGLYL